MGEHPWWVGAGKPWDLVGFPLWASMSPAWQVLSEVTEDNLIDLGPGSPAVVSPTVGSTAPPSSLSSQLAGLGECPWPPPTSWPRGGRSMGQCGPGPAVPASAQGFSLSLEFEPVGNLSWGVAVQGTGGCLVLRIGGCCVAHGHPVWPE